MTWSDVETACQAADSEQRSAWDYQKQLTCFADVHLFMVGLHGIANNPRFLTVQFSGYGAEYTQTEERVLMLYTTVHLFLLKKHDSNHVSGVQRVIFLATRVMMPSLSSWARVR